MFVRWLLLQLISVYRRKDRARWLHRRRVTRFDGSFLFWRHELFWSDEWIDGAGNHYSRPPWWRPFNAFLHWWKPTDDQGEGMHDHPRWSITICLRGKMIEHTPWGDKVLTPGSIVVRSRKYIHSFSIPEGYSGKTWTLFVVGRRNHRQNSYVVTAR
jgi:hypothetical protein